MQPTLFDYAGLGSETRIIVQQRTTEIKGLMKRAAQDIIDIGQKLIEVKARLGHGQFGSWLAAEFEWTDRTAARFIAVASKFDNLSDLNIAPSALYLLSAPSTPDDLRSGFIVHAENGNPVTHGMVKTALRDYAAEEHSAAPLPFTPEQSAYDAPLWVSEDEDDGDSVGFDTASQQAYCKYCYTTHSEWGYDGDGAYSCQRCDHRTHGDYLEITPAPVYDGDEWYTPAEWLGAARALYGGVIDLDPASCVAAQAQVQATTYYSKAENGLEQPWIGNIWCNPPYSTKLVQAFTARAHAEYSAGRATAILLLVNNCTDARWFSTLANMYPVMFSYGRSDFWRPDQTSFATRQGQALFYLGPNVQRFYETFADLAYAPNWRIA
jgi:hypothetical protein